MSSIAVAQNPPTPVSQPPAKSTTPVETDIGRVTTDSGQSENAREVIPSATIDRADAIAEKQQAPNLIDVQPLSEIIKLPDINTAEALQRIPGISLETDSGEGRFVHIRGLDADLNGTSYGGVRLPASNASSPSGEAVQWLLIPFPPASSAALSSRRRRDRTWTRKHSAGRSISYRARVRNMAARRFSMRILVPATSRCAVHRCITGRSAPGTQL